MERNIPLLIPVIAAVGLPLLGAVGYHQYTTGREEYVQQQLAQAQASAWERRARSMASMVQLEAFMQQIKPAMMVAIPVMLAGAIYLHKIHKKGR